MNNEIREILEQLEWYRKIGKKDVYYPEYVLSNKKAFILLDYITKLQKENEILKDNAIHNDKVVDKARWNEKVYKLGIEKVSEILKQTYNMLQNGDDEE